MLSTDQEGRRLHALIRLAVLDTAPERAYDDITRMASQLCGTPIALVSLIDSNRQWFKSRIGLAVSETPRNVAFCAHAIEKPDGLTIVKDASADARFADNSLVTDEPKIRFYAGAPLVGSQGDAFGTLCVIDRIPRQLSGDQLAQLRYLADQVVELLEKRMSRASKQH